MITGDFDASVSPASGATKISAGSEKCVDKKYSKVLQNLFD